MSGLSRSELQERNRARVLAAAHKEFAERGFAEAKVDTIAERVGLTRGAVYSNFPGKRALYFAALADRRTTWWAAASSTTPASATEREALGSFARAWANDLPVSVEQYSAARLEVDLVPQILAEDGARRVYAGLTGLCAVLLGLSLERVRGTSAEPPAYRRVRVAEIALTTLRGASQQAMLGPAMVEPFDLVSACEAVADLELNDYWPTAPDESTTAEVVDHPWAAQAGGAIDELDGTPVDLAAYDGVVCFLGVDRFGSVEATLRSAPPGTPVVLVLTGTESAELPHLARLQLAHFGGCLRAGVPEAARPAVRAVTDAHGALAAAADLPPGHDRTEAAVRVAAGRLVARAEGRHAAYAVTEARARETS